LELALPRYELDSYVQEHVGDDAVFAYFVGSRRSYADNEGRVESLFVDLDMAKYFVGFIRETAAARANGKTMETMTRRELLLVLGLTRIAKASTSGSLPAAVSSMTETGIASWYGYPYHGRRAADGEIYDMEKLTAAHPPYVSTRECAS
jgi:hypothetical protein